MHWLYGWLDGNAIEQEAMLLGCGSGGRNTIGHL
jgi:hypothetical protein